MARKIAALPLPAPNTTTQGRRLQDLVEYVLGRIPGVTVEDRNTVSASKSEEKDLWVAHEPWRSRLPLEPVFPVECKNENTKVSAAQVRDFAAKVRHSGGMDGLIVTREGLSGSQGTHAHDAVHVELASGIRLVVITASDLASLVTTQDLVAVVNARFREVRSVQDYLSI